MYTDYLWLQRKVKRAIRYRPKRERSGICHPENFEPRQVGDRTGIPNHKPHTRSILIRAGMEGRQRDEWKVRNVLGSAICGVRKGMEKGK